MKLISRESEEETDIVNKACLVAKVSEKILRSLVASAEIKLAGNFPPSFCGTEFISLSFTLHQSYQGAHLKNF